MGRHQRDAERRGNAAIHDLSGWEQLGGTISSGHTAKGVVGGRLGRGEVMTPAKLKAAAKVVKAEARAAKAEMKAAKAAKGKRR